MKTEKAIQIFENINSEEYSIDEKGRAVFIVMEMPTHNSITKETMIKVIKWLFGLIWEVEKDERQAKNKA